MANGPVTFNIEVDTKGEAKITFPPGASQQINANKWASFTEKLGKLLGRIKERHQGKPQGVGTHVHSDGSVHTNH